VTNRRLRFFAGVTLLVAVAGPTWVLVTLKRTFYSDNVYTPSLVLIDPNGGVAALQLDKERRGAKLPLGQTGSNANISITATGDGARYLVFVDAKARRRALFGMDSTGTPRLELFDEKGQKVWAAAAAK
jgi:hypothetical protein